MSVRESSAASRRAREEWAVDSINVKTGATDAESSEFIRNHFEQFDNKKNVQIGNENFAADFVDHRSKT